MLAAGVRGEVAVVRKGLIEVRSVERLLRVGERSKGWVLKEAVEERTGYEWEEEEEEEVERKGWSDEARRVANDFQPGRSRSKEKAISAKVLLDKISRSERSTHRKIFDRRSLNNPPLTDVVDFHRH